MANSITIHSNDENGNSFEITLKKSGPDTGAIEIKKLTQPIEDQPFDVFGVKTNQDGTKITCKANVFLSPDVTCVIDDGQPDGPSLEVNVSSFAFKLDQKFKITEMDFGNLTQFVKEAGFPLLP